MDALRPRSVLNVAAIAVVLPLALAGVAGAQQAEPGDVGRVAEHENVQLVGHDALQGRRAYQPIIEQQGDRHIAYVGHHGGEAENPLTGQVEPNGVSIVDVTDPRQPEYLHHLAAHSGENQSQMVQTCPGAELPGGDPGTFYLLRTNGVDGHDIYDVTDPSDPTLVTSVVTGLVDTHKSWWECSTGIGYLVSGVPAWGTDRMLQVFDLSDPENPVHIRDFGLPGTQPGEDSNGRRATELHEPLYLDGKVYIGYGTHADGILQILDNDELLNGDFDPKWPTDEQLLAPQIARLDWPDYQGVHTTIPLLGMDVPQFADFNQGSPRDFVAVINEAGENKCDEGMHQFTYMTDVTDDAHPIPISSYAVPEDEGDFCERGGRFGAHSTQWNLTENHYRNRVLWVSYFNAGVRALDVRDPYDMEDVGHFIPEVTDTTMPTGGETVIQTNNVEVDDRGFVYIADRAGTGMHVLYPTGELRRMTNLPPLTQNPN
ncbi:MAG: hypothetical protein GEU93_01190 [Propionibacteriales bacterium]|nr:hypothetical protein [Propionibacteriales bacterium]